MTEFLSYFELEPKNQTTLSNNTTSFGFISSSAEGYYGSSVDTSIEESFFRRLMIIKNTEICGGQATIMGTRICVSNIIELVHTLNLDLEKDTTIERIISEYPFLNAQQINAALEYYYENKDEIDNFINQEREIDNG
ncbi:MAG: DUF433 domain-containing protein [Candidatus Omnitrophota bacterium]